MKKFLIVIIALISFNSCSPTYLKRNDLTMVYKDSTRAEKIINTDKSRGELLSMTYEWMFDNYKVITNHTDTSKIRSQILFSYFVDSWFIYYKEETKTSDPFSSTYRDIKTDNVLSKHIKVIITNDNQVKIIVEQLKDYVWYKNPKKQGILKPYSQDEQKQINKFIIDDLINRFK